MTEHRLLADLPAEAVDAFVAIAGPDSGSRLMMAEIRHLGGALGEIRPGHGALASLEAGYLLFGGGLAATPEMVAGLEAALPRFKAAMAEWDAGRGYLNFEESAAGSQLVLRRGHPPAPAPHQDAGRPGRHLRVQPPDRAGRVGLSGGRHDRRGRSGAAGDRGRAAIR